MQEQISPVTGIIAEDRVVVDFGEHEGKSILEVSDTDPDFYDYLIEQKNAGRCTIRRSKDKVFRLYIPSSLQ